MERFTVQSTSPLRLGVALANVMRWAMANPKFQNLSPLDCARHAREETDELVESCASFEEWDNHRQERDPSGDVLEEACDTMCVAMHAALRAGFSVADVARELSRKLEINERRVWGEDGRHITARVEASR